MLIEFKESLQKEDIELVYQKYLMGHKIWFFEHNLGKEKHAEKYDEFKIYIAGKLDINVNDIAIVGSAKLGFSLSPAKKFKTFDRDSDIDLVIVSKKLYRDIWDAYIDVNNRFNINYRVVSSEIFRRFISLNKPDIRNDFFNQWTKKINPLKKDMQLVFDMPHEINYRVYESWDAVKDYHISGLTIIKKSLEK